MNPVLGVAVYLITWWLAFFAVLPIGAKSHHEAGEPVPPGSEAGAPLAHRLPFKVGLAAVIAAVVSQTTSPAFIGAVSASPVRLIKPQ